MAVFQDKETDQVPQMMEFAATNRARKEEAAFQHQNELAAGGRAQQQLDMERQRLSDQEAQNQIHNARQAKEDEFAFASLTRKSVMEEMTLNEAKRQALLDLEGQSILNGGEHSYSGTAFATGETQNIPVAQLEELSKRGQPLPGGITRDKTGYAMNGQPLSSVDGHVKVPVMAAGNQIFQKAQEINERIKMGMIHQKPEEIYAGMNELENLRKMAAPFVRHVEGGALTGNPFMSQAADILSGGQFRGNQAVQAHRLRGGSTAGGASGGEGGTPLEVARGLQLQRTQMSMDGVADFKARDQIHGPDGMDLNIGTVTPDTLVAGSTDHELMQFTALKVIAPMDKARTKATKEYGSSLLGNLLGARDADKALDGSYGATADQNRRALLQKVRDRMDASSSPELDSNNDRIKDPMDLPVKDLSVHGARGNLQPITYKELDSLLKNPLTTDLQKRQMTEDILPKLKESFASATTDQKQKILAAVGRDSPLGAELIPATEALKRRVVTAAGLVAGRPSWYEAGMDQASVGDSPEAIIARARGDESRLINPVARLAESSVKTGERGVRAVGRMVGLGKEADSRDLQKWVDMTEGATMSSQGGTDAFKVQQRSVADLSRQELIKEASKQGINLSPEQLDSLTPKYAEAHRSAGGQPTAPSTKMPITPEMLPVVPKDTLKEKDLEKRKSKLSDWIKQATSQTELDLRKAAAEQAMSVK